MSPSTVAPVPELPFAVAPPFPPGDPRWRELAFLRMGPPGDRVWRRMDKFGRRARRAGTRNSPLAFAYVYLARTLDPVRPLLPELKTDDTVKPVVSFSAFHLAMAETAKAWTQPGGQRIGIIAPRGAAKSTWAFLILPLWAIAHGHRNFFMGYAHNNEQAVRMLDKVRGQLANNRLLLFDFPELATPKGGRANNQRVEVASGAEFGTSGIDKITLGASTRRSRRPDILVVDDGEPNSGNYNKDLKSERLDTIRDIVLPMTPEAAVLISGTVVMPNSIGHDLVRAALGEKTEAWVSEERITAQYFNAIQNEGGLDERSLWPERWSLEFLQWNRETNPAKHALHFANQPMVRGGDYWQVDHFKYAPRFPRDRYVMWIDPAVSTKERSCKTAMVVVSANATRIAAVVEMAWQGHTTLTAVGDKVARYKRNHPEIRMLHVCVEKNNGGEALLELIEPRVRGVPGVKLHLEWSGSERSATGLTGKMARIEEAFNHYDAGHVWHRQHFTDLEPLLTSYPKINDLDLPDALAGALRKVFTK